MCCRGGKGGAKKAAAKPKEAEKCEAPASASEEPRAPKSFAKRDALLGEESKLQAMWTKDKAFEVDAPAVRMRRMLPAAA